MYRLLRKIKNSVRNICTLAYLMIKLKSLKWGIIAFKNQANISMIKKSGRGISIPNYNICITHPSQYFILSSFSDLNIIQSMLKANFKIVDNQFYVEWDDLILNVKCKQELFTMKEVFVFQEYNYIIEKPSVLIDIGFNVGYTSLFFAKNEMVKKVYAFEPFDETLEQGKLNLSLNPMLKEKVILYNYGLSGKDEERCIWYNFNVKGGIGKLGNDVSKISDSIKKRIILKRFDEVYSEIAKKEIGNEIILKIDCEGDEYEIVKSFHNIQQELLPGVLLIEWHSLGDEEIIKHIRSFGYHIFSFHVENKRRGNLYCLKK